MTASISVIRGNTKDELARAILEESTWPGEVLLGFVQCRLNPGTLADRVFMVGLTPRRFLLVSPEKPERSYSIYRDFVQKVNFGRAGWLHGRGLRIELGGDTLSLACSPDWSEHARQLVETYEDLEPDPLYLTSIQFIQQTTDLTDLGMLRAARTLLRENMQANPVIEIEPEAAALDERLQDSRTALRTGAAIFTFTLFFMTAMAITGHARLGLSAFLMLPAVTGLLRGQQSRRGFALFMALLVALGSVLLNAMTTSYLNVIMWASFGAAMFLTLSGQPRRPRVSWAVMIFILGFILIPLVGKIDVQSLQPSWFNEDLLIPLGWI